MSKLYTGRGDDGTTGLYFGGRVPKDDVRPEAYGTVDEAQASIGLARAAVERGSELDDMLIGLERDLYVLMAELATAPENEHKLTAGQTSVTDEMVDHLEALTDDIGSRFEFPTEFVVPGQSELAARLDVARATMPPGRASRRRGGRLAVSRRAVPQPPVVRAVDHGAFGRGRRHVALAS